MNKPTAVPYRTVLGFETHNEFVGRMIEVTYVFVVIAAWFFALSGLSVILTDWGGWMRALVATAIVGIAFTIKLALFGRRTFPATAAFVACLISLAPFTFDFFGLYQHTGVAQMLADEKGEALVTVNDFNAVGRREVGIARSKIEADLTAAFTSADRKLADDMALFERRKVNAHHLAVDERVGVPSSDTTGVVGAGPVAALRESASRRESDMFAVNKQQAEREAATAKQNAQTTHDAAAAHLDATERLLNQLVAYENVTPVTGRAIEDEPAPVDSVADDIVEAPSFGALYEVGRHGNGLMAQINSQFRAANVAGSPSLDPKDITVEGGNLFDLSVRGLMKGDIAAYVSLFLAFLFEMMDIVVVYFIRRGDEEWQDRATKVFSGLRGDGHEPPAA